MSKEFIEKNAGQSGEFLNYLETCLLKGRIGRRQFIHFSVAAGLSTLAAQAMGETLDEARANQDKLASAPAAEYDYIVCGAGSSGCVIAARLAENPNNKILLVEAGDWDTAPSVLNPGVWFTNLGTERDWGDICLPSPAVNNLAIPSTMARVVGGGSSINATIWVRGHKNDFEHWADQTGDKAWGYEHSIEIYRRVEDWQGNMEGQYRGRGGKVWVEPSQNPQPIAPAMVEAAKSLGMPTYEDLNDRRGREGKGGFALMNHIIKGGQRRNMAQSYLYPVLARTNITVMTRTHADRLMMDGAKAIGVEVVRNDKLYRIKASREVIVSLGGIRSSKLLMLSGIGDEKELGSVGIKTLVHAPEVGKNFHDQILHGGCLWQYKAPMAPRNSATEASGFWRSDLASDVPDINPVQIELPYTSEAVAKQYSPPGTTWALCAGLVQPRSRGTVKLRSSNPSDAPIVDPRFLSHPDDVKILMQGIELCREIGNAKPLADLSVREVIPGKKLELRDLENFARNGTTTFFHQVGTCRMGKDEKSVVDASLRVRGVANLRVADGSVMPRITSCATMSACVYIGERMAEILRAA
jgi:choline dehydrogenase